MLNLLWSATAFVFALAAYAASFGYASWLWGRGTISGDTYVKLGETVYSPVGWWMFSNRTGAVKVWAFSDWCYAKGRGDADVRWSEIERSSARSHARIRDTF